MTNRETRTVDRYVDAESEFFSEFTWTVPKSGYCIESAVAINRPKSKPYAFLVDNRLGGEEPSRMFLKKYPNLYRKFITVDIEDEKAILKCANQFGLLTEEDVLAESMRQQLKHGPVIRFSCPSGIALQTWRYHVGELNEAITLWDALKDRKEDQLRERIIWEKDGKSFHYYAHPRIRKGFKNDNEVMSFARERPGLLSMAKYDTSRLGIRNPKVIEKLKLTPDNVRGAGWYVLQVLINHALQDGVVVPAMLWTQSVALDLYVHPLNLLGALWIQFAQDVEQNKAVRKCPRCQRKVSGAPQKIFCSRSCGQMDSRMRKRAVAST